MIILTGGAGFIGSCFLSKLNSMGIEDVIIVDNLASTSKWKNLVGKKFISYENKAEFRKKLHTNFYDDFADAVIHLGACSSTTEVDIDYLMDNNLNFSVELCDFCITNDIPFHYASSAATYGMGENGYSDKSFENLKPLNGYGFSKQLFDDIVIKSGWDQQVTGYKFFNVFGPNEYHKDSMASMVYKAYNQIKSNEKVKLFKSTDDRFDNGGQMRDFIYVNDVVNVMWDFFDSDTKGIYNLGTGKARNWNDLMNSVFKSMDSEPNIEYIDMPDNLVGQYQNFTEADMSKFKSVSKYKFGTLEESVNDYVQNYLSKDWKYL